MIVPKYSRLIVLVHLYLIGFIKSDDDILENFEMAPIVETENSSESSSEFTETQMTDNGAEKMEVMSDNNILNTTNSTKQSKAKRSLLSFEHEQIDYKTGSDLCPYFTYITYFNMERWADVWQPVYYHIQDKLKCFKIHVKKLSEKERGEYEELYGNFNGSVDWNECHFQIESANDHHRRHFLLGGVTDLGVMRNILIVKNDTDSPKTSSFGKFVLREESPYQWMMVNDLLMIRDCVTGGTVVLARLPVRPAREDVRIALREIGVQPAGKFICDVNFDVSQQKFATRYTPLRYTPPRYTSPRYTPPRYTPPRAVIRSTEGRSSLYLEYLLFNNKSNE